MRKTYLEFGSFLKKTKKKYEVLKENQSVSLYDTYMFTRYFRDIYVLENKKKLSELNSELHDIKDLKFSFIIYVLLISNKLTKYYEFGSTIFERYFYLKFLEGKFNKKTKIKKFYGNDISDFFIYISNNIFKNIFDCLTVKKFDKKLLKKSVFFSKGISLLYEKKNKEILKSVFSNSKCGFFDFSILKKSQVKYLNTGKKLYYLSHNEFFTIIKKFSSKSFYFRKVKKIGKKIYFECMFGDKDVLKNYINITKNLRVNKNEKKFLDLNLMFTNTDNFKKIVKKML